MKINTLSNVRADLGEGPVWDEKNQILYWIDILNGLIHEYHLESGMSQYFSVGEMIGSYALTDQGNLIVATQKGFGFIDKKTGDYRLLAAPERNIPDNRFNDGKCDPAGRFWAGTMSLTGKEKVGTLYKFDQGKAHPMIPQVSISNGLAWSSDAQTMYYIDTPTRQVVGYDFNLEGGLITNKRVVISLQEGTGYPDGMTIDADGMLWIAHWGGWRVSQWDPKDGTLIREIELPVEQVTSVTFGGKNLDQLFITSAKTGLSGEALRNQPLAGSVLWTKIKGVSGKISSRFLESFNNNH
jgi:sugar lactone lactonase YvrE